MSLLFESPDMRPESCALVRDALAMIAATADGSFEVDERSDAAKRKDKYRVVKMTSPPDPDLYDAFKVLNAYALVLQEEPRPVSKFRITLKGRSVADGSNPWPVPETAPEQPKDPVPRAVKPESPVGAGPSPYRSGPGRYVDTGEPTEDPESHVFVRRASAG